MINFYRRFIPNAAKIQVPLNNLLHGNTKGKTIVVWNLEAQQAFQKCKDALAQATLLEHPKHDAPIAIFCDASDYAIGATLQQNIDGLWRPLSFFSRKLRPAEQKYAAYDREFLAIYEAIKHFRYMVEGRTFTIYTDQKPLISAFKNKSTQSSPRQFRHLDFIGQFTCDIRHISGSNNVVADALSLVEQIDVNFDYQLLADSQMQDQELQNFLKDSHTSLQFQHVKLIPNTTSITCDISTGKRRPFVTQNLRKAAFNLIHNLSHPGVKATVRLVTEKFVWPSIKKDCQQWAKECLSCQRSKISRHVLPPIGNIENPSGRFQHVHLDIIVMPYSDGYRYCLTMIDRFTRWPEVTPLKDQEAETIARVFYDTWIARFGVPLRVTTDQGRQFESHVFNQLNHILGTKHIRNGMIERFHRQLKAALRCHEDSWIKALPTVLLGIRSAWKEDILATTAELVYGQTLALPGEFLTEVNANASVEPFVKQLRQHMQNLRPAKGSRHGESKTFIFKDLKTTSHVFVRNDATKLPLQDPYKGPYRIISRAEHFYNIDVDGKETSISINRLKPAFIETDFPNFSHHTHTIHRPQVIESREPAEVFSTPPESPAQQPQTSTGPLRTRSGRLVRFPDRFQAGFRE